MKSNNTSPTLTLTASLLISKTQALEWTTGASLSADEIPAILLLSAVSTDFENTFTNAPSSTVNVSVTPSSSAPNTVLLPSHSACEPISTLFTLWPSEINH